MTEHKSLVAALAAFHTEAVKVVKDATAQVRSDKGNYSYGYADLATVSDAVNPLLGKHGLAFISKPTLTPEGFGLVYKLAHESGEDDEEGFWPLPDPTRVKPQEMGSWITYWRRYALLAVTNTFPSGEDDDGAKASSRDRWEDAKPQQANRPVSAQPAPPEKDWSKATDDEIREMHGRINNLPIGQAVNGYDWMAGKGLHNRKVEIPTDDGPAQITATEALAFRLADLSAQPDVTAQEIADLKAYAEARGLLKVQVSEETTLDEELAMALDTAGMQAEKLINQTAAEVG